MRHQQQVDSRAKGVEDGSSGPVAAAVGSSHVLRDHKGQRRHDVNGRAAPERKTNSITNRNGNKKRGHQPSSDIAETLPVKLLRPMESPVATERTVIPRKEIK